MGSPPATSPAASLQQIHKRPSPAALLTQLEQLNPRQRCFELIHTPCLARGRAAHQGHLKHQLPLVHQASAPAPFSCLPWCHGHLPLNSWHVSSTPKKINFFFFFPELSNILKNKSLLGANQEALTWQQPLRLRARLSEAVPAQLVCLVLPAPALQRGE